MRAFDFVIVGAGAAGCVVASRLAAQLPDAQVLLVEAGADRRRLFNAVPLLSGFAPFQRNVNWLHPASHAGRDTLLYQGRMVGGSSEINGMVVSRGEAAGYRAWEDAGGETWRYANCLAAFRRLERHEDGTSEYHGGDGPMSVRHIRPYGPLPDAFLSAAAEAGFPVVPDLNAADGARFGLTDINTLAGRRHSARTAFLPRLPDNLTILGSAHAARIEIVAGTARALVAQLQGREERIEFGCELVIACGAVGTAALLLRSGIGPIDDLLAAGIKPVQPMAEVGANLQNHPSYLLRVPTHGGSMTDLLSPAKAMAAGAQWILNRTGPLAQGLFQAAGYVPIADEIFGGGAQVVMSPALFPAAPPGVRPAMPRQHGASFAIQQGSPFSRGRVSLGRDGAAAIETGALADPRDLAFMEAAIGEVQAIVARPAFRRHVSDLSVLERVSGDAIRRSIGTAYHMAGTARMGMDDDAVTDPRLRLRGVSGVRIADASIIPVIPNAALHFPTMMIAERAAEFVIAERG
jgi:choline dehydrogenase